MADSPRGARLPLAVDLTIPGEAPFVETVRALSVRVAEFVGYDGAEAAAIGAAVVEAVSRLVAERAAAGATNGDVAVHFSTDRGQMLIDLTREDDDGSAPGGRAPTVHLTRPLPGAATDPPA